MTGAISAGSQAQYLDKLQVERERGITVKVGPPRTPASPGIMLPGIATPAPPVMPPWQPHARSVMLP